MGAANRTFYELKHQQQGLVKISFSFAPAGTSAPTGLTGKGVASVTREGVGDFEVTLEDPYLELISGILSPQMTGIANTFVEWGDIDVVTAKTLRIHAKKVVSAGSVADATVAAVDIAADANNRIHGELTLRRTSVT